MKNKEGITLVSLIITIVILLILASIATYSGISVIKSSRLTAFVTELKIMQTQVNAMYEKNGEEDSFGEAIDGEAIDCEVSGQIAKVFRAIYPNKTVEELTEEIDGYKYWSKEKIQELGIDVEQSFFVNLKKRSVVSEEGFEYEGKVYYTLEQFADSNLYSLYNVEYKPNEGEPTFTVEKEYIGSDKWRITISKIEYKNGYIDKWEVKYKLKEEANWNTSQDLSFVVNQQGTYEIQIENNDIKSGLIQETIKKEYVKNGLLLHYDAINNIGEGDDNHSTTTNVWKDLSGHGNDAQLNNFFDNENSKWNDNYLQLDGINDYAEVADNNSITPTAQTIEIVFNRTGNTEHLGRGIIFVKWYGYTVELNPINSSNQFTVAYGRNNGYLNSNKMLLLNRPYSLTLTHEQNLSKMYIDTIYENQQEVVPINYNSTNLLIGKYNDTTVTKANIYAIRMYDRALTQDEIKSNYEIDKIRFGLENQ